MKSIPNRLLFVPILIVVCGMIGVITLYGWRCGNKEDPTNEIEWDAIKIKKKMNAVKDLRIDDVINFFHDEDQQDEEYSLRSESMATSEPGTPAKKSFIKSHNLSKPKKEGLITQQYVPEEDDTKKLIEAHFRGKPVNINFDKERGEILISYKPKTIATSIWEIVFSKQMAYLHLR
jgi:hypothetical protein